ncbi:MAG: histidinol dehydrogenase [Eubacteriales bacterium]|nr:histidinol dehydrogenase [Eubacteriales bacterium]MDD4104620.1 histidinol dehydrogenase [Eubacteriales bacterium]MDD4710321.1 histidinol dehydrogenase [Eubacteriales bacterium]
MIKIITWQNDLAREALARRSPLNTVRETVQEIIRDVRDNGDEALFRLGQKFDNAVFTDLEVSAAEWEAALLQSDARLKIIMEEAADNIRSFHMKQLRDGFEIRRADGAIVGQRVLPVERAGLYVPGGTAAYYSTVLMNAIPAKAAGVKEIIMVTPAPGGVIKPDILSAARIAGVDRVFKVGGAQAIAALAMGTASIPRVDCIVGPGNAYVAEAKRQVYGLTGIDMIAGPSEILIVSDEKTDAQMLAADLLSQAEHDKDASAVLVTDSMALAGAVSRALEEQIPLLSRADIARTSIDENGRIIVTDTLRKAVDIANDWAPEHLELCVDDPFKWLDSIVNAGSIFLGRSTPEAVGDYWAGTNHTLPTSGTARFSSPLSVEDFIKVSQYIYYPREVTALAAEKVAYFAGKEGLEAHARSVLLRK